MAGDFQEPIAPGRLRVMQIVAGALVGGVSMFLVVVLFLVFVQGAGPAAPPELPLVSLVGAALLVMNAPLAFILPRLLTRKSVEQIASGSWQPPGGADAFATDTDRLLAVYQTAMIVGMALLEGVGLLGCIGFLLEKHVVGLVVTGVAVLLMLARFPTRNRVEASIERARNRIDEIRTSAS